MNTRKRILQKNKSGVTVSELFASVKRLAKKAQKDPKYKKMIDSARDSWENQYNHAQ